MKTNYPYFCIKLAIALLIFALLPLYYSILAYLLITWAYPYIVALIFGVKAIPSMDLVCFYGDNTSRVNFMSSTKFESIPFEKLKAHFGRLIKQMPKLRYSVVEIFGDYYYKELPIE